MSRYLLLLVLLVAVPFSSADSFKQVNLSSNTFGLSNPVGFVYLIPCFDGGCNIGPPSVLVEFFVGPDAGIKLNDLSIVFNSSLMLTGSNIGPITIGPYIATNFTLGGPVIVAGQTFTYSISNINGGTLPNSYTSTGGTDVISFSITRPGGVETSQLLIPNAQGNMWGVKLCLGGTHNCGQTTGFAFGHVVPEPGSSALVGTGVLALVSLMCRKRRRAARIRGS